jgi:hypothetical protein
MRPNFVHRLLQEKRLPLSEQAFTKNIKGRGKNPPRHYFLIPLHKKIQLPDTLFGKQCVVLISHLSVFEHFDTRSAELNVLHHTLVKVN